MSPLSARRSPGDEPTAPKVGREITRATRRVGPSLDGGADGAAVRVGDIVGHYVLVAELGRGGMGTVFTAHDFDLERQVAIKFVSGVDATMTERFLAEARATARCTHPNIVGIHEIGRHRDAPYLVLEYLAGVPLARLARAQRLPVARVLSIMTAVARALACAHSHGIVHRDLSPNNIVVLADDTVKVLDFGIAAFAQAGGDGEPEPSSWRRGVGPAGTLPYTAPEQLLGGHLDGRADLWSCGILLYELLAGSRPFDGDDEEALRAEILHPDRPAPSIARLRPDLPPTLVQLVALCLEKSRARRHRSANALIAALQRLAGGQSASELPSWLASGPPADESDRIALGLVRALAVFKGLCGIDVLRTRVWPDGRVDLAASAEGASASDDVRAVALLAGQALDAAGGVRSPSQQRRARRMRRALRSVLDVPDLRRSSVRRLRRLERLERRLTAAHTPRHWRAAIVALTVSIVAVFSVVAWQGREVAKPAPLSARSLPLERLESSMARLRDAGDAAAAGVLFDRFVTQPENTALAADAWMRRGARELAARDFEAALDSAGAAYFAATDAGTADRALASVAAVHLARRSWPEVGQALATIGASPDPVLTRTATALAIATRRPLLPDAPSTASDAAAAGLLSGRPEAGAPTTAIAIDLDGDGRDEVAAIEGEVLTAWRPGGARLWQTPWSGAVTAMCAARDTRGAWLAVAGPEATRLFQVDAGAATLALEVDAGHGCALGDLDGDGAAELYVKRNDVLDRHRAEPDGSWRLTRRRLGSEIYAITAADLDGDGRDELAVTAGEWRAYDVRVLAGPELSLIDRVRLGRVTKLAVLAQGPGQPPILLALKDGLWPSAWFLPRDQPSGVPDGYYSLRFEGRLLTVAGHLARDRLTYSLDLRAADVDGDGRDEGLESSNSPAGQTTLVLHLDDTGQIEGTTIDGVAVLAAGRFGDDRSVAALARVWTPPAAETWWLGLGATPVPPLPLVVAPSISPPPDGLDAAMERRWRRAADLGHAGATASARAAFEQLAAVVPPEAQSQALTEALALRRRRGEPLGAIFEALASRTAPGSRARLAALLEAITATIDQGELAAAARLIEMALASPAVGERERAQLHATLARVTPAVVELFDGDAVDEGWTIEDPIGVRRDPVTRTLILDGLGARPLATVDLVRSQGPVELEIEGTITRAEWAAGLAFTLRPLDVAARDLKLEMFTSGGGGVYDLVVEPAPYPETRSGALTGPLHDIAGRVPIRARVTWLPDTGRIVSDVTAGGANARRVTVTGITKGNVALNAAIRWRLELTSTDRAGEPHPTRMAMSLARVSVSGLEPAPVASFAAMDEARRMLANGELENVPALLAGTAGPMTALIAGVHALRSGDRRGAVAALTTLDGVEAVAWLAHLMRVEDGVHAATIREAAGSLRTAVIAYAWTTVARQHPQAELVQRELTQHLRGLELRGADAETAYLLLLRGRAFAAIGEFAAAGEELDALRVPARLAALQVGDRPSAHLEHARLATRRGDNATAVRSVQAALAESPWPEATADSILLDPELAPLAGARGLEQVRLLGRSLDRSILP